MARRPRRKPQPQKPDPKRTARELKRKSDPFNFGGGNPGGTKK